MNPQICSSQHLDTDCTRYAKPAICGHLGIWTRNTFVPYSHIPAVSPQQFGKPHQAAFVPSRVRLEKSRIVSESCEREESSSKNGILGTRLAGAKNQTDRRIHTHDVPVSSTEDSEDGKHAHTWEMMRLDTNLEPTNVLQAAYRNGFFVGPWDEFHKPSS